jgi:hypothetical protein
MKIFEKDFLSDKEVNELLHINAGTYKMNRYQHPIVDKIVKRLLDDFNFEVKEESYWRIEQHPTGHSWHIDTGDKGHMLWCQVGVSILLTSSFTGGETYYTDDNNKTNVMLQERGIGDLCAHTSDQWHMVTPHKGKRIVFLMFI